MSFGCYMDDTVRRCLRWGECVPDYNFIHKKMQKHVKQLKIENSKKKKLKYCVSIHLMFTFRTLYISLANVRLEKLLSLIRLRATPSFRNNIKLN